MKLLKFFKTCLQRDRIFFTCSNSQYMNIDCCAGESSPVADCNAGSSEVKNDKFTEINVTLDEGVQVIRFNRPHKYNAITWQVLINEFHNN